MTIHRSYDIMVAYRIYPKVSKLPLVHADDKYSLSEVCLRSFRDSLGQLKARLCVLLDNCPYEYQRMFLRYFKKDDLIFVPLDSIGNRATFGMQLNVLSLQGDSEAVYFAEDDYFYLPGQFVQMVRFLLNNRDVHFVTPYDHPDYYTLDLHDHTVVTRVFEGRRWRKSASTTLTFLTTRSTLQETSSILNKYAEGSKDSSMWLSLTKMSVFNVVKLLRYSLNGQQHQSTLIKQALRRFWRQLIFGKRFNLWSPVPSIATHMESRYIAPGVNWGEYL